MTWLETAATSQWRHLIPNIGVIVTARWYPGTWFDVNGESHHGGWHVSILPQHTYLYADEQFKEEFEPVIDDGLERIQPTSKMLYQTWPGTGNR